MTLHTTENDALGDSEENRQLAPIYAASGTVGFDGDADATRASVGDGTDGPEGRTLVNVTLFMGRDITKRPEKGKAQGRRIKAQIGWPVTVVPPLGMQVVVVFPDGDMTAPGAGVIVCGIAPAPTKQFALDRAIIDVGADHDLALKGRSVIATDHTDDTSGKFGAWIGVGPIGGGAIGVYANDGNGAGVTISGGVFGAQGTDKNDNGAGSATAKSILQLTKNDFTLAHEGGGYLTCTSNKLEAMHAVVCNVVGATVGLGPTPTVPASAVGAPGLPSTCVLITM